MGAEKWGRHYDGINHLLHIAYIWCVAKPVWKTVSIFCVWGKFLGASTFLFSSLLIFLFLVWSLFMGELLFQTPQQVAPQSFGYWWYGEMGSGLGDRIGELFLSESEDFQVGNGLKQILSCLFVRWCSNISNSGIFIYFREDNLLEEATLSTGLSLLTFVYIYLFSCSILSFFSFSRLTQVFNIFTLSAYDFGDSLSLSKLEHFCELFTLLLLL